jgi:hypothetical protein
MGFKHPDHRLSDRKWHVSVLSNNVWGIISSTRLIFCGFKRYLCVLYEISNLGCLLELVEIIIEAVFMRIIKHSKPVYNNHSRDQVMVVFVD